MSEAAWLLLPGAPAEEILLALAPPPAGAPLISCLMASRGRIEPARHAIDCFRRQTYPNRELLIACAEDGAALRRHVADIGDPRIRLIAGAPGRTAGELRNIANAQAQGRLACVWDDDDLSGPERLTSQYGAMAAAGVAGCFLVRVTLWWPARGRLAVSGPRIWENTMLVERAVLPPYGSEERGSDTALGMALRAATPLVLIDRPEGYCYVAHAANLWSSAHFEMLFDNAGERWEGDAYEGAVAVLGMRLPLAAYAAEATSAGDPLA